MSNTANFGEKRRGMNEESVKVQSRAGDTVQASASANSAGRPTVPGSKSNDAEKLPDFVGFGAAGLPGREVIDSIAGAGKAEAFVAKLVQGWEAYSAEQFQPMQMLQNLQICGPAGAGLARLTGPHPLEPPALRHIHSSPLQSRPSVFDDEEDLNIPPPIPLDPFQRSSSTPSAFRQNSVGSAFGAVDRSAFSHPSQRYSYKSVSDTGTRASAFDPVKYYARALEDMERTSIEVMDMSPDPKDLGDDDGAKKQSRGAAFRAARFLSDVRILRRRRRVVRGGRGTSAPASDSIVDSEVAEEVESQTPLDTSITVITENDFTPTEKTAYSRNTNLPKIIHESPVKTVDDLYSSPIQESDQEDECKDAPLNRDYHKLDSDVDEEEEHYHKIEAQLQAESPGPVPLPMYQRIVDEKDNEVPHGEKSMSNRPIRFYMSNSARKIPVSSPSPTRMENGVSFNLTPRSTESANQSPGTTRSFNTGSSSGHTTQATSCASIGPNSGLSTISETDREVMEANKEGKRRRGLDSLVASQKVDGDHTSVHSSSTGTGSSNLNGYLALGSSPVPLRDGANVPADRFFTDGPAPASQSSSYARSYTFSSTSRRSGQSSPGTLGSGSMTHTSSSSSSREEPPTFVSYLDRQAASDLTMLREASESSSPREVGRGCEEREGSPADFAELHFEDSIQHKRSPGSSLDIKPMRDRNDRIRSLPPRSPSKGLRPMTTPPPRGSVSPLYQQQSPPRNIVNHPESHISRPHVMRKVQSGENMVDVDSPKPVRFCSPVAGDLIPYSVGDDIYSQETESLSKTTMILNDRFPVGRNYEEHGIEILKTDSREEVSTIHHLVTPEKEPEG